MRRAACGALGVVLVAATSGCGIGEAIFPARTREVPRSEPTSPVAKIDCPPDGRGIDGVRPQEGSRPTAAPKDFVATAAIVCSWTRQPGGNTALRYTITVKQAPVTPALTDALQLPDLEFDPTSGDGGGGVCAADYQIKPYVLLVDNDHHGYRPALPVNECDKLRTPVIQALSALTLTTQRSYRIRVPF